MKCKRTAFWLLLIVAVSVCLWWTFYVRYDPVRVYRAIPANALLITEHDELATRLDGVVDHPLTEKILLTAGCGPEDLREKLADTKLRRQLKCLTRRITVFAYVPDFGRPNEPAWVAASWVGSYAHVLRTAMFTGAVAGLTPIRLSGGRRGWVTDVSAAEDDPKLSLALVEGVLLACLSHDPMGVRRLIARVDQGLPLNVSLRERAASPAAAADPVAARDRAWFHWYRFRKGVFAEVKIRASVAGQPDGSLVCGALGGGSLPGSNGLFRVAAPDLGVVDGLRGVRGFLGDAPDALVLAARPLVETLLLLPVCPAGARDAGCILDSIAPGGGPVLVSLFGGDYSGRAFGLKVPAILVGARGEGTGGGLGAITNVVDDLNASHGWGLVPREVLVGGGAALLMDTARDDAYGNFKDRDKPVVAREGDWSLLVSNLGTLGAVRAARDREVPSADAGARAAPKWHGGWDGMADVLAYGWLDLRGVQVALRNGMAAYALALMVNQSDGAADTREQLDAIGQWLKVAAWFKDCEFVLTPKGEELDLRLTLRPWPVGP